MYGQQRHDKCSCSIESDPKQDSMCPDTLPERTKRLFSTSRFVLFGQVSGYNKLQTLNLISTYRLHVLTSRSVLVLHNISQ